MGAFSLGIVFDGANIWVANAGSNSVAKLRASDGTNLGVFSVGSFPVPLAFDGTNVWVANRDSATVTKLRASDGVTLGTFPVGISPQGLVSHAKLPDQSPPCPNNRAK
jgi:hypothetical protein